MAGPLHDLDDGYPDEPTIADLLDAMRRSENEMEEEKCCVARTLHDEVGGLLSVRSWT